MNDLNFSTQYTDTYFIQKRIHKWEEKMLAWKTFSLAYSEIVKISPQKLFDFFQKDAVDYIQYYGDKIYFFYDNYYIEFSATIILNSFRDLTKNQVGSVYVNAHGNADSCCEKIEEVEKFLRKYRTKKSATTKWAYLDEKHVLQYSQLNVKKVKTFHKEMYPFIEDFDNYFKNFLKSSSNILVFTGEPGTGKSNLINYFLQTNNISSIVAYDSEAMGKESLYIDFLKAQEQLLILEDSDIVLGGRLETGNTTISKILNVSDGIIEGKKFIFTANINSIDEIDKALMRPGRCFDVQFFRKLTFNEAEAAAKKINKKLNSDKDEWTVAEIYNEDIQISDTIKKKKIGF